MPDVAGKSPDERNTTELRLIEPHESESLLDPMRRRANELRSQLRANERSFERQIGSQGLTKAEAAELQAEWAAIRADLDAVQQELTVLSLEERGVLSVTETGEVLEARDEAAIELFSKFMFDRKDWQSDMAVLRQAGFSDAEIPVTVIHFGKQWDIFRMVEHINDFPTEARNAFLTALADKDPEFLARSLPTLHDVPNSLARPDIIPPAQLIEFADRFEGGLTAVTRACIEAGQIEAVFPGSQWYRRMRQNDYPTEIASQLMAAGKADLVLENRWAFKDWVEVLLEMQRQAPEQAAAAVEKEFKTSALYPSRLSDAEFQLFREQIKNDDIMQEYGRGRFTDLIREPEKAKEIARKYQMDKSKQEKIVQSYLNQLMAGISRQRMEAFTHTDDLKEKQKKLFEIFQSILREFDMDRSAIREALGRSMSLTLSYFDNRSAQTYFDEYIKIAQELGAPENADFVEQIRGYVVDRHLPALAFLYKDRAIEMEPETLEKYVGLLSELTPAQRSNMIADAFTEYVGEQPTEERAELIRNISMSVGDIPENFAGIWRNFKEDFTDVPPETRAKRLSFLKQVSDSVGRHVANIMRVWENKDLFLDAPEDKQTERLAAVRQACDSVKDHPHLLQWLWEEQDKFIDAAPEQQADFFSAVRQTYEAVRRNQDQFKRLWEERKDWLDVSPEERSEYLSTYQRAYDSVYPNTAFFRTLWSEKERFLKAEPERRTAMFDFVAKLSLTSMPYGGLVDAVWDNREHLLNAPPQEQAEWLSFVTRAYEIIGKNLSVFSGLWKNNELLLSASPEERAAWLDHFKGVLEILGPDANKDLLRFACRNKGQVELPRLKRALRVFGAFLTGDIFITFDAFLNGESVPEFSELGVTKTGEAGALELERALRGFRHDFLFKSTGDFSIRRAADSSAGRAIIKNLTRFTDSAWGSHDDHSFAGMLSTYRAKFERGILAPLPPEYEPSETLRVATLDETSESFPYAQGFLDRFHALTGDLAEARRLVRENPEGGAGAELVKKLIESVERHNEEVRTKKARYEAIIADPSLADNPKEAKGTPFALKNLRTKQESLEKAAGMLDPKTWKEGRAQELFSILADVPETASDLRRLVFTYSLYLNPTYREEHLGPNAERPTEGDISRVIEFVDHVTNQETFRQYFTDDKARKKFDSLCNVSALEAEAARLRSHRQATGTTNFAIVPSRDFKTELSGHMADACWANKEESILEAHPNFISLTFVQNPGSEVHERVAGACLLIETEAEDGTPLLVIRGLNPIENVATKLDAADFFDKLTAYLKPIAEARGRELCVVVDNHRGGSASNRQSVFDFLSEAVSERGWKRLPLKSADDTTFNGYNITNETYSIGTETEKIAEAA